MSPPVLLAILTLAAGASGPACGTPLGQARGTDYYVSPTGSDAHRGTSPLQPWRTLARVNAASFSPGDRVLLRGGAAFAGGLTFDALDAGTPASPVVVGSYGRGRARVVAGEGNGLLARDVAGLVIRNLTLTGSGPAANRGDGINFYTDLQDVKLGFVRIQDVEVSGFGGHGVAVGSGNGRSGYRDVRIERVAAHGNGRGGILTFAAEPRAHQGVYVGDSRAYENPGTPDTTRNSGNGIVLGGVDGGLVERCVVHGNGRTGWLPNGVWAYDSRRIVIQLNEAYDNHSVGPADGGGFALDQHVSESVLQYNWSHDNDGAGYLLAHRFGDGLHAGNIVRYNVSQNDGRRNGNAAIRVWGGVRDAEIHNNTVYVSTAPGERWPRALGVDNATVEAHRPREVRVRSNIFVTAGGLSLVAVTATALGRPADLRLEGNAYHATGGPFRVVWGATVYEDLGSWREATAQERVGDAPTGFEGDPGLAEPGGGGILGDPDRLAGLDAYRLASGSGLVDAGLNLPALFGVDPGPHDFYGTSIPQGRGYEPGAHEVIPGGKRTTR